MLKLDVLAAELNLWANESEQIYRATKEVKYRGDAKHLRYLAATLNQSSLPSTTVTSFNTRIGDVVLLSTDVTAALGYNPVTQARTLTINGVTYDLSANRSWTISTATPTLAQVTTAGNTTTNAITVGGLTVATNLIYTDTVNGRVGIGTTGLVPGILLTINGSVSIAAGQSLTLDPSANIYMVASSSQFRVYNGAIAALSIPNTGNVLINTTTDAGYKLDVNGSVRVVNDITSNSTFIATNTSLSGGTKYFSIIRSTDGWNPYYVTSDTVFMQGVFFQLSGQGGGTIYTSNSIGNATTYITMSGPAYYNPTSGVAGIFAVTGQSRMSSGTAQFNTLTVGPTINNTGTYSGIFRGFYYNPTLTSLTGTTHRGMEISSGDFIWGNGYSQYNTNAEEGFIQFQTTGSYTTRMWLRPAGNQVNFNNSYWSYLENSGYSTTLKAGNYHDLSLSGESIRFKNQYLTELARFAITSGNLLIGTTTDSGYKLQVNGNASIKGSAGTTGLYADFGNPSSIVQIASHGSTDFTQIKIGNNFNLSRNGGGDPSIDTTFGFYIFSLSLSLQTSTSAPGKLWLRGNFGLGSAYFGANNSNGTTASTLYFQNSETPAAAQNVVATFNLWGISDNTTAPTIPASSMFSLQSTTRGFLQPRMTNAQAVAITTPATGLQVYDTTNNKNLLYNGTAWQNIATETWVSAQGYLTTTPTLDQVTTAGNTTTNAVTVGNVTINGTTLTLNSTAAHYITFVSSATALDIQSFNNTPIRINNSGGGAVFIRGAATWISSGTLNVGTGPSDGLVITGGSASNGKTIQSYGSHPLILNSIGNNVLIGTTTDAGYKLDVNGDTRVGGSMTVNNRYLYHQGHSAIQYFMTSNAWSGVNTIFFGDDSSSTIGSIVYNHQFDSLSFNVNGANAVFIGSSCNMMIGTTTDAGYKLDVNGSARVGSLGLYGNNGSITAPLIKFNGSNKVNVDPQGYGTVTNHSLTTGNYIFTSAGGVRSNDGFGAKSGTSVVSTPFMSYGISRPDNDASMNALAGMGGVYDASYWFQGLGLVFYTSSGSDISGGSNLSEKMRLSSVGNLGIGTSSPTDKLHIVDNTNGNKFGRITAGGTDASAAWVAQNDQGDNVVYRVFGSAATGSQMGISLARSASLMANLGGSGKFLVGTYSSTDFVMGTGNQERMRLVDSTGNFLIGTTVDSGYKLNVNGSTNISNNLNVGGVVNTAATYTNCGLNGSVNVATNSTVIIGFTAKQDPNGWWNAGTKKWTPTIAGYYYVALQVRWDIGTLGNQINIQILRNTSTVAIAQDLVPTNVGLTQTTNAIVYMNGSTDYLEFSGFSSSTTGEFIFGEPTGTWTFFNSFRIN